jgi:hypothetical protein
VYVNWYSSAVLNNLVLNLAGLCCTILGTKFSRRDRSHVPGYSSTSLERYPGTQVPL